MSTKIYWVYILLCENDSYYTGYTDSLIKRYQSHVNGTGGCKYTRSFKPKMIAQCWEILGEKALAMQLERTIKKLTREQKNQLVLLPSNLSTDPRVRCVPDEERLTLSSTAYG